MKSTHEKPTSEKPPAKRIEFDINEIKTFKFKKSLKTNDEQQGGPNSKNTRLSTSATTSDTSPWGTLMEEIRSNAGGKNLKNVTKDDSASGSSAPTANSEESKLVNDLNSLLKERSKFFVNNDDDDDDETSSESEWNESLEH